tara:strand:+ start:1394 stop:1801 length:408 start_codon:yes stop_codon:yes gene_type:complete
MIQDISYFNHTLDEMKIQGTHKRIWLKQFKRDPKKTTQQFYNKLDRLYSGWRGWEIAKKLLIEAHPNLKEPQPWAGYERDGVTLQEEQVEPPPVEPQPWTGYEVTPPEPRILTWDEIYKLNNYRWGCSMYDWENQ